MDDLQGSVGSESAVKPGVPSLAMTRIFGVLLIPASFVMAYFTILKPLREAQQTGVLHYYEKGLLFPPGLLYMGIALLVADLRDGQIRKAGPDGKRKLTRKGWIFLGGLVVTMGLTQWAWSAYLHRLGYEAF